MEFFTDFISKLNSGEYIISKLTQESELKSFCCGNPDLNDFLFNDAKVYAKYLRYTTFLIESSNQIIAYYSLANDTIQVGAFQDNDDIYEDIQDVISSDDVHFRRYILKQRIFPAVKIGRLAVSKNFQNKGYGTDILGLLVMSFIKNNKTGCQFITVDAINRPQTTKFYEKNDFKYLTVSDIGEESRQMYKILIQDKSLHPFTKIML